MSLAEAFAPAEARDKSIIMTQTWGHLFPKDGTYKGKIRVAYGVYGDLIILDEQHEINSSPWWHQNLWDFIGDIETQYQMEEGEVYEIDINVLVYTKTEDEEKVSRMLISADKVERMINKY